MTKEKKTKRAPLQGTQLISTIATGGGGGVFQARVGALYLANMLTGVPSAFGLHGARVETLRFEARYTGAHTDDIYCQVSDSGQSRLQLIQCKRGLNATASDEDFIDGLQGAWRDYLGVEGSPFDRACDVLILATVAPATPANQAAKRLCELSRSSLNLADFLQKLDSKLFDAQHKRTWSAFKEVSRNTLADKYSDELVFDLLLRLRVDIHDLGTEGSQELSLVQALLASNQPGDSGEQVWNGLFSYVLEQGISVGTITPETWKTTAQVGIQEAVSRLTGRGGLGSIAEQFRDRARHQLSLISTKLPNGTHIPRGQCVAQALSGFDERQLVIVTGGPGAGKSAVIAELAPLLHESGPLFFFRADELSQPSLAAVQSLSSMPDAVLSMESLLRCGTPTVVIDSLEKALEARSPGALEELLALVRQHKGVRLCVTTRSYALNALYSIFLADFSYQVVDVPLLTDAEISSAVTGTALEDITARDGGVREVLRAPYYLRLAFNYTATGAILPQAAGNDLRLRLWTELVAPSRGLLAGMAERRRIAFNQVCYERTERFAQFVQAPADAEAVAFLVQDGVLTQDATLRVAPTHDVLEDWSLFFRVDQEVRGAERAWGVLFGKLGSHAGMRRALRTWTAQRSAEGDADAYALLEAALKLDSTIPQLWRDEVAIGLLRSERVEDLVAKLSNSVFFNSANLLQRLSHLLRVACKGPTSIDYSHLADDPTNREIMLRIGMAAPVGKAWDVVIGLVAKAFPGLPSENYSWIVQLAEDATSHDENWHKPTQRVVDVFNMAEHFCLRDEEDWYREQSISKRFYALLCRCVGADSCRFTTFTEALLRRFLAGADMRDSYAEERLQFLVNFKNCREVSFFVPDLVWKVFWNLYTRSEPEVERDFGVIGWESAMGLSQLADQEFFPPSVLQGPFRSLLLYAWPKSVRFVVDLCNHAAKAFATMRPNEVSIIPLEQSPNDRPHIHDYRLWATYRSLSVTSYLLNAALMALEERLLIEAKGQPKVISKVLEIILELGESSFTTGMVAGVLMAHPQLVTEKMLSIFKCPQFFSDDIARRVQEAGALAIHGGHDGLDDSRQQERSASNRLPHRRRHLEDLVLQLQFNHPDLLEAIHRILDSHSKALNGAEEVPDGWRMTLKRMDIRGLKLGEVASDGKGVSLEIANLEPELRQASDKAQAGMQRMNRIGAVSTWAAAVTGRFSTAEPGTTERFSSPSEPYEEFLRLCKEIEEEEVSLLAGLEDELACALVFKWPADTSQALQWARALVLERTAVIEDKDAWMRRDHLRGEVRARAVVSLAAVAPSLPMMVEALVNIVTEPMWKIRRAAAKAISDELRPKQPMLAEVLTNGLAQYAEALDVTIQHPRRRTHDFVSEARAATAESLNTALRKQAPAQRPSPKSLAALKEWAIALDAACGEIPDTWRVQTLMTLTRLMVEHEKGPRVQRHDPDYVDFEARWEFGDLIAVELMAQSNENSPLFDMFDHCIESAPELSERVLESVLSECMKQEFANAQSLWRVWDRATARVFGDDSLRTKSRRLYSRFDKILGTLLLCSTPWPKAWHDLALFRSRPHFISSCLTAVGDSRKGLEHLLQLMAGVGRKSAIPSALPQLRDALDRAPVDLLDDGNSLWHAETICRIAVHDHREILIRDINLRRATLDILDRLVDAGSSLGFQLRDYLATSPIAVCIQSSR
ncbi:ATP-binding protein [Pseudomonas bijieensis]|uniref:ATP-binding protein n=1 Tax=Pseudomonas bijieensis TaxID=2681983 RepID=UPI001E32AE60|nr:ATP-binding protein [Pseudomonas bijieensis]MCD9115136.1 ATP-binding protein [Pseudomonas bijieensis]